MSFRRFKQMVFLLSSKVVVALVLFVGGTGARPECDGVCEGLKCEETPGSCDVVEATLGCKCREREELLAMIDGHRRRLTSSNETSVEECRLDESDCLLRSLGENTKISTKTAETGCIFGDDFAFQVFRRQESLKRLAVVFRGGSPLTSDVGIASALVTGDDGATAVTPFIIDEEFIGGLYYSNENFTENVFQEFDTLVSVPQCSGDLNVGNGTAEYFGGLLSIDHLGGANVQAVLEWLVNQHEIIEEIVVVGISGGASPATIWTPIFLERLRPQTATIVSDSSPSILTGTCPSLLLYGSVLARVGACDILATEDLREKCFVDESVDVGEVVKAALDALGPEGLFLEISSKADTWNRDKLTLAGIAALEIIDDVSPQCSLSDVFFFETEEAYYSQLVSFVDDIMALNNATNYITYILDTDVHPKLDTFSANGALGPVVRVPNPFSPHDNLTAPIFLDSTFDIIEPDPLAINAPSLDGSLSFEPSLARWLKTAILSRTATHQCYGLPVDDFQGHIHTCPKALDGLSYDAARICESTTDCPPAMTCYFPPPIATAGGNPGRCRRQAL